MLTEDPQAFLADWGEDCFIDDVAAVGIFSAPYIVDPVGFSGRMGADPRLMLPAASMPPRGQADPVVDLPARTPVRDLAREIQPDGTGWVSLVLTVHPQQP